MKSPQPQDSAGSNKDGDGKEEKGGGEEQKKEGGGEATAAGVSEADVIKKMIYWNGSFIGEDEMARRLLHLMPIVGEPLRRDRGVSTARFGPR